MAVRLMQPEVEEMLLSLNPSREKASNTRKFGKPGVRKSKSLNVMSLSPFKESGIWWTKGRLGHGLGLVLARDKLPLLPATCRLATLIMLHAHSQAHRGGSDTCNRSRAFA